MDWNHPAIGVGLSENIGLPDGTDGIYISKLFLFYYNLNLSGHFVLLSAKSGNLMLGTYLCPPLIMIVLAHLIGKITKLVREILFFPLRELVGRRKPSMSSSTSSNAESCHATRVLESVGFACSVLLPYPICQSSSLLIILSRQNKLSFQLPEKFPQPCWTKKAFQSMWYCCWLFPEQEQPFFPP